MQQKKLIMQSVPVKLISKSGTRHKNIGQIRDLIRIVKRKSEIKSEIVDIKSSIMMIKKSIIRGQRCEICLEPKNQEQFETIAECEHKYCGQCLLHYISAQLALNNITLNCINQHCQKQFNEHCLTFMRLTENQKKLYYKLKRQQEVLKDKNNKFCPTPDCQGILKIVDGEATTKCKNCNYQFCANCLLPFHVGSCDTYAEIYLEDNYHFMKCKSCNSIVQKIDGCNHITCRCGYQFCYLCGGLWTHQHLCPQYQHQQRREPPQYQHQQRREPQMQRRTCCQIIGAWVAFILLLVFGFPIVLIIAIILYTVYIIIAAFFLGFESYAFISYCLPKTILVLITYPFLLIACIIMSFFACRQLPIYQCLRYYINILEQIWRRGI